MHFRNDLFCLYIKNHVSRFKDWITFPWLQILDPSDSPIYHQPWNVLTRALSTAMEWYTWKPKTLGGWFVKSILFLLLIVYGIWHSARIICISTLWLAAFVVVFISALLSATYLEKARS